MSDRFRNALQSAWKRVEERQWIYGSVGRLNADTTYTYEVPGRKNFIYVTVRVAGGAQTAVPARNDARVPLVPKLAVKMKLEYGTYVIHGKTGRQEYGVSDAALDLDGTLLGLDDTPDSYVGQSGKIIAVNITEDAVEFIPAPSGGGDVGGEIDGATEQTVLQDANRFALTDSGVLKWVSWSTIKTTLTTLFNGLYTAINTAVLLTGDQTVAGLKSFMDGIYIQTTGLNGTIERLVSGTASPRIVLNLRATSNGSAVDGFGPAFFFDLNDLETTGDNPIAVIAGVRDGADNSGAVIIRAYAAGVPIEVVRFTKDGRVGIGTPSPEVQFHVSGATAGLRLVRTAGNAFIDLGEADSGTSGDGMRLRALPNGNALVIGSYAGAADYICINTTGMYLGGNVAPQGKLHAHDGTGGMIFVSKTGITNVTQTIIPDGTGDVTGGITGFFVANDGSGAVANTFTLLPGDFTDIVIGGYTMRLALSAAGALTAVRQSGTGTGKLTILACWQ